MPKAWGEGAIVPPATHFRRPCFAMSKVLGPTRWYNWVYIKVLQKGVEIGSIIPWGGRCA